MIPMGRSHLVPVLAIAVLVFVWTLRWQMSSLALDYGWVSGGDDVATSSSSSSNDNKNNNNNHNDAAASSSSRPAAGISKPPASSGGLGHPLPSDIDLSDPDAPFIGWPLRRACDEVEEWQEGVTFVCDNNFGGVGNVRNFILTCVRYAIEAGATGLVMPAIRKRNDMDIKDIYDSQDFRPFSYLFDEENFRSAMGENCPQMTIYDEPADVPNISYVNETVPLVEKIDPRYMGRIWGEPERCDFAELDHHTDRFGYLFRKWVMNPKNGVPPSSVHTRMFRGTDRPGVLWEWPVWHDGPELATTFGGLCKFNKTIMQLGKRALAGMQRRAREHRESLGVTANDNSARGFGFGSFSSGGGSKAEDEASRFIGIHLRTEADAEKFWPTYADQEDGYLAKAAEIGLPIGYIASGNLTETRRLSKAASEQIGLTLVSKHDILSQEDLELLRSLSWDQQGLIDYIVLAGSEYFAGNSRSSFSISMCLKRNLKADGLYSRPYKVRQNGFGRSFVVGPKEKYFHHWLFIWDAMWP